jgi:glutamate synthase (ferredoxin)
LDTHISVRPGRQGLYDPATEHDACGVGFVADIKGRKSHGVVDSALEILVNLTHRGACGCEANTGDGAGILLQIPDAFFRRECAKAGIALPPAGQYGTGIFFLPRDEYQRVLCEEIVKGIVESEGQVLLGWRDVPTRNHHIGDTAKRSEPVMRQAFIGRGALKATDADAFERKLFVIRKCVENAVLVSGIRDHKVFYVTGLSSRTICYKGMLDAPQVSEYFPDLTDPALESALALVHSRFSTNTFPSWDRAHPYRFIAHNGEINTLRGNVNWMRSREALLASPLFGEDIKKVLPVIDTDGSDSAMLDNVLEMLVLSGRSLPHAMMMLIPEAWQAHENMAPERRAFYEYHACLMEPWDGPAAVVFTDGRMIGATLDRNGLRPGRYYVTADDRVVMASEVGVLPEIPPEKVVRKGRLQPGRMFLVDLAEGRIVDDAEIKARIAAEKPYGEWVAKNMVRLEELPVAPAPEALPDHAELLRRQMAFGYTQEDLRILMEPMAANGEEAVGSMGTDTPPAVLSLKPQLLYNYFQQLFAQVTNPPLDAIREELVTSVESTIGAEHNILDARPETCRQIRLKSPILDNAELAKLRHIPEADFKAVTLSALFPVASGESGLRAALDDVFTRADRAIAAGRNILIVSDRGVDAGHAPVPMLLAIAGLHHHLIRQGTRGGVAVIAETGEAREVHHFCLLIGYGASAVNPYLALDSVVDAAGRGALPGGLTDAAKAVKNYVKAVNKGVLKVCSKMGISTVQSYRGAQIFEAIGINPDIIDRYFTGTASRIRGIGLDTVAAETLARHRKAHPPRETAAPANFDLDSGGQYQWRRDGEHHQISPEAVHRLQHAVRTGDYAAYKKYSHLVDSEHAPPATIRSLLDFHWARRPIPVDEVEPATEIVRRFVTGAMSLGAISAEAHETLAVAMNRLGGRSNSGEGGEDSARYVRDPNGDFRRSAVKQVASGRFGVTSEFLVNADEIQIKMAQGAKPGEGGQLPGKKVYPWIARIRYSTPGVGLISPPPHHDIYSIEDLKQLIFDLKNANPRARISVKLVAEVGVGTVAAGVAKAHADVILISGHDGGTGASPLTSIKHAGIPWELGLAEAHQVLLLNNLRSRVTLQTDGQMKTGRDVVVAALLGAEEYGFATAALIAEGCIMMRVCHLDTCPVGVATQNPELRKKFTGKPEHVVNFMMFVAQEAREYMAKLGFRSIDEMIGRADRMRVRRLPDHPKADRLDLSAMLHMPDVPADHGRRKMQEQDHGLETVLDNKLIEICKPALRDKTAVRADLPIRNVDRTVGTMLGSELTRRWGAAGLPDDTIRLHFTGSAGNSFSAFVPRGVTMTLEGDANDYVGKGLSGGKVAVYPPRNATFAPEENILIGNVALYGATSGEAYFRGVAGERFAVRNSGASAVVEGCGDHGCEYMTGGRVVVLGRTGRNFAAGMSGGIAYVLDPDAVEAPDTAAAVAAFRPRCNMGMVDLEGLPDDSADAEGEAETVRRLLTRHAEFTGSARARRVLAEWHRFRPRFVKVIPLDYRRVLLEQKKARAELGQTAAAGM